MPTLIFSLKIENDQRNALSEPFQIFKQKFQTKPNKEEWWFN